MTAAEVETFSTAPRGGDSDLREAELAIVRRTAAELRRKGVPPDRAVSMARAGQPAVAIPVRYEAPARAASVAAFSPVAAPVVARAFTYTDADGNTAKAPIVDLSQKKRIAAPVAGSDSRINPMLKRAASIAQDRAHARSKSRCWRYVKNALLASGIISSYPKTVYAKQAGDELVRDYGFKKLPIRDPFKAPVGAVLVYGSRRAAGHVEIRTKTGFVSDFQNKKPSPRPLLGIYAKA